MILLAWFMKNPFKQLNLFNSKEYETLLTKEKIEKAIRSRAYISEINQSWNKMRNNRKKNFLGKFFNFQRLYDNVYFLSITP